VRLAGGAGMTVFLERFWLLGNHERSKLQAQQARSRQGTPKCLCLACDPPQEGMSPDGSK
jgi:hypothetical protein